MTGDSEARSRWASSEPAAALERAAADGLLPPGARLLLALSGGRDSASLLHALWRSGRWPFSAAIVDHGLFPTSRMHALSAAASAATLGIEARILEADRATYASQVRLHGPEAAARDVRYRCLREHAAEMGAIYIVTAHTADDQAETLLMRLGEGTGLRGLAGIPRRNGMIIRPWLEVSRADVAIYAATHGVQVVEDPSNVEPRFLRNAVRGAVLPAMAACFGEDWSRRASRTAANLASEAELVACLLAQTPGLVERRGDAVRLPDSGSAGWPTGARRALVNRALVMAGATLRRRSAAIGRILRLTPGERISLGGGWTARSTAESLVIEPAARPDAPTESVVVSRAGSVRWGEWRFMLSRGCRADHPHAVALAVEQAPLPWTIRCVATGERFQPRGAPGSKSIRRLWADRQVPARWRPALPVIESAGRTIWAAGLRAAEHVRVEPGTPAWLLSIAEPLRGPGLYVESNRA